MINGMIDLDGTVSNWVGWVSKSLGRNPSRFKSRRIEEAYNINEETALSLAHNADGYGGSVRPITGAAAVLRGLYKTGRFRFYYVSAAPVSFQGQRLLWLIRHQFPIDPNNKLGATLLHVGSSEAKITWMKDNVTKIQFVVDDDVSILDAAKELGVKYTLLISTRFNQHIQTKYSHVRIRTWEEARGLLLSLE